LGKRLVKHPQQQKLDLTEAKTSSFSDQWWDRTEEKGKKWDCVWQRQQW